MTIMSRFTKYAFLAFLGPVAMYTLNGCATPAGVRAGIDRDAQVVKTLENQMNQCQYLYDTAVELMACGKEKLQQTAITLGASPSLWDAEFQVIDEMAKKHDAGFYDTEEKVKSAELELKSLLNSAQAKLEAAFDAYKQKKIGEIAQAKKSQEAANAVGQTLAVVGAAGAAYTQNYSQINAQTRENMAATMPASILREPSIPSPSPSRGTTMFINTSSGLKQVRCIDNYCF